MNKPATAEAQEILNFTASLLNEATARALVVIGAARLEEEVKAIVAIVAPGFEAEHRAHSFRIDLLVSIGILSEDAAFCLKKVTKIRNHFAHTSADVTIQDVKIQNDVQVLYSRLDQLIGLFALSGTMFEQITAKIPHGAPPATWVDDGFRNYQTSIVMLLWHLVIVRHNIPEKATPIQLSRDGYWQP
jgi:hypothetical protein